MKKLIFLIFIVFIFSCGDKVNYCDNPEIDIPDQTQIWLEKNLNSGCGYSYVFKTQYADENYVMIDCILLTNDKREYPDRQLYRYEKGLELIVKTE